MYLQKAYRIISYFWKFMAFLDRFVVSGLYYCSPSRYRKSCKICLLIKNFCMSRGNKKDKMFFCTKHGYKASFLEGTNCSVSSLLFHASKRSLEQETATPFSFVWHFYSISARCKVTLGSTTFLSGWSEHFADASVHQSTGESVTRTVCVLKLSSSSPNLQVCPFRSSVSCRWSTDGNWDLISWIHPIWI